MMDVLEYARRRNGLTQTQLGMELGVSKQLVSAWETGAVPIDPKHHRALEKILGISFDLPKYPEITEMLTLARKRRGITLEQLGNELGVPKTNISAWENGTRTIPYKHFDALSKRLGVSIDDLKSYNTRINCAKPAPDESELDRITRDMARRIHERAFERATSRITYLRGRFIETLQQLYPKFPPEQCSELIAEISSNKVGNGFIRAELSRMASNIAFLADDNAADGNDEGEHHE